ncbi:MAG: PbsX family transcriptional regulator [Pseudomonas sp.]|nr:PbsX family transcriptional regulator [Pseudomonas sp.]
MDTVSRKARTCPTATQLLAALILLVPGPFIQGATLQLSSVVFWYADNPPLAQLAQFDWSVVEPDHLSPADVDVLRSQGGLPFAYLSVGEFHGGPAELKAQSLSDAISPVRNGPWNSQVMNLESQVWRDHLFTRAADLRSQGYAGLFLDTLDSFQLLPEPEWEAQRIALTSLLRELHQRQPLMKLFFNRGFEVLQDLEGLAAAVAVESIRAGWDASTRRYRPVPKADRQWLESQLRPLRDQTIPLVAIEYLPPERRDEARRLVKRLRAEGFVPYVASPDLDSLGVGTIDVVKEAD